MLPTFQHAWDLAPSEAIALQKELSSRVAIGGSAPTPPFLVAGCDASATGRWVRRTEEIVAGVLVFQYPGWELVDCAHVKRPAPFPYVPGLLSFREVPLYVEALSKLRLRPDLLLCDGQGIAHPRRFGLAAHLGLLFDLPSIGVAKSRLIGQHTAPGWRRGSSRRLTHRGQLVGRVLRTRDRVKPLFVSPGHRMGIEAAAEAVLRLTAGYRLPEPTRRADIWVGAIRRGEAVV